MIDEKSPDGRRFAAMLRDLQERRFGRKGVRSWDRGRKDAPRVRPPLTVLNDYREGDPPLRADIHSGWKPHVRQFVRMGRLNMADLIVSATANRMQLRDFRTAAADDEFGDAAARAIMRANDGAILSAEVHETLLALGDAYVIVGPVDDETGEPLITAESPFDVITMEDAITRRTVAGLKIVRDEWDSADLAFFYASGVMQPLIMRGPTTIRGTARVDLSRWETYGDPVPTRTGGIVPVVRFRNRDGVGEFERHLDSLDRINDKIFNEWWIAKIQAFRQRAIKNLPQDKEEIDADGNVRITPIADDEYDDMFTASPDEMWQVPGDVEFWESSAIDMTPITAAIEKDVRRLAAVTSVALPSMVPDSANGSAEGASLMREEHIFKVEDRIRRASAGWTRVLACAFEQKGDSQRADLAQIETIFGPVERHSLQQKASAASLANTSLPREAIQRDIWQYPPAEISDLRLMTGRELLFIKPAISGP